MSDAPVVLAPARFPRSPALLWLSVVAALVVAAIGFGLGFYQDLPAQVVIAVTILTAAASFWFANAVAMAFEARATVPPREREGPSVWRDNRVLIVAAVALALLYGVVSATVPSFRSVNNLLAFLILEAVLIFAFKVSRVFTTGRSAFIGLVVLFALVVISSFTISGFLSSANIRAILLFASFLGIACIGQTLVALMGGLDLSIPFVIGSSNIGMLYLIGLGVPSWLAFALILVAGGLVGLLNGLLSFRLQGQALILTLGTGFALAGLTQILTSIGSSFSGTVFGTVPGWLANVAAMNGRVFGLGVPPAILIWIALSVIVILGLRVTVYGRNLYALGGNRRSAKLAGISELKYWTLAYVLSGTFSAATGALLLGWSGGGFIGSGDQYLFTTLSAVVIGGTSLAGGYGGYGFTVIGVLVLQVLSSFLIGVGLKYEWQQFIFGLLIVPMVALYGRAPHIRSQV